MHRSNWLNGFLWVFSALSALGASGATSKKTSHGCVLPIIPHAPDQIVVAAYGDTRTGPYGLGDNPRQRIHRAVVRQLLTNKDIDAVLFTGDAVMTNFPLWARGYWQAFFKQTDWIVAGRGIPFFPSLGNHETYDWIPAFTLPKEMHPSPAFGLPGTSPAVAVSKAYDSGEESAARPSAEIGPRVDPNTKEGQEFVDKLLSDLDNGTLESRIAAARAYGQFEGAIQNEFYNSGPSTRCGKDAETFRDRYVKQAGYDCLGPYTSDLNRSFYSQVITNRDLKLKLIALDTNCLDEPAQLQFFQSEIANFEGKIVVFGHHPPVQDDAKGAMPWDVVPSWKDYRPYFSNTEGRHIVMWVFGHVHDYQRRSKTTGSNVHAPVLIIAGGGGASLDENAGAYQWQPDNWDKSFTAVRSYTYVKLVFTKTAVELEAFGSPDSKSTFKSMDKVHVDY